MDRWQSTLGLAMRARKVVMGDALLKCIQKGQACLVILADDCGENQRKKNNRQMRFLSCPADAGGKRRHDRCGSRKI